MALLRCGAWLVLLIAGTVPCFGQKPSERPPEAPSTMASEQATTEDRTAKAPSSSWDESESIDSSSGPSSHGFMLLDRFAGDQKAIWSSPTHLHRKDAYWMLPSAAITGAFIAGDSWFSKQVPVGEISRSRKISDYGAFSLAGAAGGMFLFGKLTHNDHAAETGFLAGEAAVNATVVDYAFKSMFQRERPYQGSGAGRFFSGGTSFPSEHAGVSWAIAGVVAHEYPGPLTKLMAYGLATAVSATRVTGKEHFPSDVVVGGAMGYFIAQQIYRRRRDPEVSEAAWGNLIDRQPEDKVRNPQNMGSPYVPPDSWVYPLFERLAALGYIKSGFLGIRPWTRMQCAHFLEEVADGLGDGDASDAGRNLIRNSHTTDSEAMQIFDTLRREFTPEARRLDGAANVGVELDSVYERTTNIAGKPLTDGFHFAQTVINDYGRPYAEGTSLISGLSGHAEAGPLSFSFQGEYQRAPAIAPYSPTVQQAISVVDQVPPFDNGTAATSRFQVINSSVGVTFRDLQFSFGKQAQWLGVGDSGPFLASNNASSILMGQVTNVVPFHIPLLSAIFGPARSVFFIGQLTGQNFVFNPPNILGPGFHPQPFIHGNKVSFKPTPNLEFGMGVTAIFGGPGLPFTFAEFFRSYYSHKVDISKNPAKRFSGFDISYRVPGLRKWLTVYNDALVGDEISPIGSTRPMLNPGLYMPQVPKIPKLELRVEGMKDPFTNEFLPGFVYYDRRYRSGYTNAGSLIGSWVGRDGFGAQAQATYWLSPQTKLQAGYRYQEVDRAFLQGGRLTDYSLRAETRLKSGFAASAFVQYEQWMFPILAPTRQANIISSLQLTFYPRWGNRN